MAKLGFLARVLSKDSDDLCGRAVLSLCDDFDLSCLVRDAESWKSSLALALLMIL